jgi:hypothetical protein
MRPLVIHLLKQSSELNTKTRVGLASSKGDMERCEEQHEREPRGQVIGDMVPPCLGSRDGANSSRLLSPKNTARQFKGDRKRSEGTRVGWQLGGVTPKVTHQAKGFSPDLSSSRNHVSGCQGLGHGHSEPRV